MRVNSHLFFLIFARNIGDIVANQYDPHLLPLKGPQFEGWYIRVVDFDNEISFGILWGTVVPENYKAGRNLDYAGILYQPNDAHRRLQSYNFFPSQPRLKCTVKDGYRVTRDPNQSSPPNFNCAATRTVNITIKPFETFIHIDLDEAFFSAKISLHTPWGTNGEGPMGFLSKFPLPLYWFVYSLASSVSEYTFTDRRTNKNITNVGGNVFAHMEKNWGNSFPSGWIWAQGFSVPKPMHETLMSTGSVFALEYGPINLLGFEVIGFFFGYRNYKKQMLINLSPVNALQKITYDECRGNMKLILKSFKYRVQITMSAPPESFSECLPGPLNNGFRPVASESFVAKAKIIVSKKDVRLIGRRKLWRIIDVQSFSLAALEFGGKFTCNNVCRAK